MRKNTHVGWTVAEEGLKDMSEMERKGEEEDVGH